MVHINTNPYSYIYVDITSTCNMQCTVCYRDDEKFEGDVVSLKYFEQVCKRLPGKVLFRLTGGEPTISKDFFKYIEIGKRYNHIVTVLTNGLRLADLSFCKELKSYGYIGIGLSMNGGTSEKLTKIMHGHESALSLKLKAIENMSTLGFRRVALTGTIVRGLNESIILDLLRQADKYPQTVSDIHFRNQLRNVGRFYDVKPYTVNGLKRLVFEHVSSNKIKRDGVHSPQGKKCYGCCYVFKPDDKRYTITIVDSAFKRAGKCWYRGKLGRNFQLTPFFYKLQRG